MGRNRNWNSECVGLADESGEIEEICKMFMEENPNYDAWFDSMESHAGYYPVVITDKHIMKIPARYVFESIAEFKDWAKGVVLE